MITLQEFAAAVPCSLAIAAVWHPHIEEAAQKWGIDSRRRMAGFIAQMSYESARFTKFTENLDYSVDGLARTWPTRFAVDSKATVKVPTSLARQLGRSTGKPADQRGIANSVYGSRGGNTPGTNDGWNYRGRGPKQITFLDNYKACGIALGLDLVKYPDLLLEVEHGASAAAWYWATHGCNILIDRSDYMGVTRAINGGLNGFEDGNLTGLDDRMELHTHTNLVLCVA